MDDGVRNIAENSVSDGSGMFIWLLVIALFAVAIYMFILWRSKSATNKQNEVDRQRSLTLQRLAERCWTSYRAYLVAKGRNSACRNFLTGDGALMSVIEDMQRAHERFSDNPDRLALVIRERNANNLINYAVAKKFYTSAGWSIPSPLAPGFATKEAYLANIGFDLYTALGDFDDWSRKLTDIDASQTEEARRCRMLDLDDTVNRTFAPIRSFMMAVSSEGSDENLIDAANLFINSILPIINEYRLQQSV